MTARRLAPIALAPSVGAEPPKVGYPSGYRQWPHVPVAGSDGEALRQFVGNGGDRR